MCALNCSRYYIFVPFFILFPYFFFGFLQTTFVNSVDAPSLALLVPIVHRGLRERSAETKKKAAQIVGNMCSLVTEPKDMIPYIGLLLPEVKKVPLLKFFFWVCSSYIYRLINFLFHCNPLLFHIQNMNRFLWIQSQKFGLLQQELLDPSSEEWERKTFQIFFHGCLTLLNLIIAMLSALALLKD